MTSHQTLAEIEAKLAEFVPLSKEITGKNLTLDRMKPLMEILGNPQVRLKIIHIAGTSGKTSTAYYIASLLTESGLKTGLTVSPHVDSVLERVQINMQPLTENEYGNELSEVLEIIKKSEIEPTYFELLVAFAYWYFAKIGVDYAVVETGMGGLQDATNIAGNPDKICVITDIGMDHMHVLGKTIEQIAAQKAGIIHPGNMVVTYMQDEVINKVIEDQTNLRSASLINVNSRFEPLRYEIPAKIYDLPQFQQRNWILAFNVFEYLQDRDDLPELNKEQIDSSLQILVPGRMEEIKVSDRTIVLDGAHNEQKMKALVNSFQIKYPNQKVPVLLSLKLGKEFAAVLPILKPITSHLIITKFTSGQDLPSEAIDPVELAEAASRFGFVTIKVEPDIKLAYEAALAEDSNVILITGSFYLLGQLRSKIKELSHA